MAGEACSGKYRDLYGESPFFADRSHYHSQSISLILILILIQLLKRTCPRHDIAFPVLGILNAQQQP